jgi:hypothetical protein
MTPGGAAGRRRQVPVPAPVSSRPGRSRSWVWPPGAVARLRLTLARAGGGRSQFGCSPRGRAPASRDPARRVAGRGCAAGDGPAPPQARLRAACACEGPARSPGWSREEPGLAGAFGAGRRVLPGAVPCRARLGGGPAARAPGPLSVRVRGLVAAPVAPLPHPASGPSAVRAPGRAASCAPLAGPSSYRAALPWTMAIANCSTVMLRMKSKSEGFTGGTGRPV